MATKGKALERICVVEETAAAPLACWTLKKIDTVSKHEEVRTTVELFNTGIMALREDVSAQMTVQSELQDAQNTSSRFQARWKAGD